MYRITRVNCLVACLLATQVAYALPEDKEKVMNLVADSADLSQQDHRGKYSGNVQFVQGTTNLRAANALTQGDDSNKLVYAVAKGEGKEQAHFWTMTAKDKPLMHAYADVIKYYPKEHLIKLLGKARIVQGDNSFVAPEIIYDTEKQHIISRSDGKTPTTIVIYPEKKIS